MKSILIISLFAALISSERQSNASPVRIVRDDVGSDDSSYRMPPVYFLGKPASFSLGNESNAEYRKRDISPITYHGGVVMKGTVSTYIIWYGNWANTTQNRQIRTIITAFLSGIGQSSWYQLNTPYTDSTGAVSGSTQFIRDVGFGASTYNFGTVLSGGDVARVVTNAISSGVLPLDSNGVYFVLTSSDVQQYDDPTYGFCTTSGNRVGYCGYHTYTRLQGQKIKYSFVGNPENCGRCDAQRVGPNGNWMADAMISVVGHELAEAATDPEFTAWYDANYLENADKCAWTFGQTHVVNGAKWNVEFGGRKWLIQQNLRLGSGDCALAP